MIDCPQVTQDDFIDAIEEVIKWCITNQKISLDALPMAVSEILRANYNGEKVTIRKSHAKQKQREQVRAKVLNEWNGKNAQEICARHSISRATLYRYLKK